MAGRGTTTFQKRQKEMQRKERQQEKFAKKLEKKRQSGIDRPASAEDTQDQDAGLENSGPAIPGE